MKGCLGRYSMPFVIEKKKTKKKLELIEIYEKKVLILIIQISITEIWLKFM
jgi:hypothetical protein